MVRRLDDFEDRANVQRLLDGDASAGEHQLERALRAHGSWQEVGLLLEDKHFAAQGHFQTIERAYGGGWPQPSAPVRPGGERLPLRMPAPLLGEHNDYVLRELLGYDEERVAALAADGTIGTQPAWREGEHD